MALVIKTLERTADTTAEQLYRDALVDNGTLILHDYSNRGSLNNFSIDKGAIVRDLSRESSLLLGVNNASEIFSNNDSQQLTPGKGIDRSVFTGSIPSGGVLGYDIGLQLANYLYTQQPNSLFVFWARKPGTVAQGRILTAPTLIGNGYNLTINASLSGGDSIITGSFAGTVSTGVFDDGAVQVGLEFVGAGQPLKVYLNGTLQGNSSGNAVGFGEPTGTTKIGRSDGTTTADTKLYRWFVEDLTVSGRSAVDIVKKDFEYCTGTGQFSGLPTKRPFIDLI